MCRRKIFDLSRKIEMEVLELEKIAGNDKGLYERIHRLKALAYENCETAQELVNSRRELA